jgi:LuxR family maltose regulon positive regulatory protein
VPLVPGFPAVSLSSQLATRPELPTHVIERPAVWSRISASVARHRVTLVAAPAGYGKTASLSAWAAHHDRPVAWLSLTAADRHPGYLGRNLAGAIGMLRYAPARRGDVLATPVSLDDRLRAVLVVDDVHWIDNEPAARVLARALTGEEPGLQVILSGRHEPRPGMGLSRLRADGQLGQLGPADLALSVDEVREAALALGRQLDHERAVALHRRTDGWPVAVRLALMAEHPLPQPSSPPVGDEPLPQLVDYLVENMLGDLSPALAEFVPQACTCEWLTGQLAVQITGNPRAPELLEQAVAVGLPLDRREVEGRDPVYQWHPVMAQVGQAMLLRRDPRQARGLHRAAAHAMARIDPYSAARHALRGGEPEQAAQVVRSHWLAGVVRGDSELVEEVCARLPAPYADDPEVLTVRALCRRNDGDAETAASLAARATAAAATLAEDRQAAYESTRLLAQLFLADEADDLASACESVEGLLRGMSGQDPVLHACALFVVGWSFLRLRRPRPALLLLQEAVHRCQAEGLDDLADRARAHRAFALAFSGDFVAAQAALTALHSDAGRTSWRRADGAVSVFTVGWMAMWTGDHQRAVAAFLQAVEQGGSVTSYALLARMWLAHAALASGDQVAIPTAERLLEGIPEETIQAMPWWEYKLVGRAAFCRLRGDVDGAVRLLRQALDTPTYQPANRMVAAELLWRCGRPEEAEAQAGTLADAPAYLRVGAQVISALCLRERGDAGSAHALLEDALHLGSTLALTRAFSRPDAKLLELLAEHARQGTRYEPFLASMIDVQSRHAGRPNRPDTALSTREREILAHLATALSLSEICGVLFISPNTLKSHLRSIYRKLGVENRRDAVRLFRGSTGPGAEHLLVPSRPIPVDPQ